MLTIFIFISNCGGLSKTNYAREVPVNAQERARKKIEEGRGVSVGSILKNRRKQIFEFSTSNPMWRASLEILDFLPMSTVDYSGGMIISEWYSDDDKESVKITLRFLSNEVRTNSIKVIVHKKNCSSQQNCRVTLLENSKINEELKSSILSKAAALEKEKKKEKKELNFFNGKIKFSSS